MRPAACLAFAVALVAASPAARAAEPTQDVDLDIPITQSIIRDGVIRYGVWIKVGERSVEALLDTGSTGLRILSSVFPGSPTGVPIDAAFGAGLQMRGLALRMPVEIGSRKGTAIVQVVQEISCVKDKPGCDVDKVGSESYRIGGDAYSSEGYSAILGIGLPFRGTDIGNPLSALGVKRWIVDLPRPYEIPEGHLFLDPDIRRREGFSVLDRHGLGDGDGCIRGAPLLEAKCGAVLFDTGAPEISLSFDGVKTASAWDKGTAGALSFASGGKTLALDFQAGESGGLAEVVLAPPEPHGSPKPFILAGIAPFFTYDILYDDEAHAVGLKKRASPFKGPDPDTADIAPARADDAPVLDRRRRRAGRPSVAFR